MTLHAIANLDDAIDTTREFLFPFDPGRWARLAVIVFFASSGGSSFSGNVPSGSPDLGNGAELESALSELTVPALDPVVIALLAAVVLFVLLWSAVTAIMEFVLVDSLRQDRVAIREYFGEHWRLGGRLFVFRLLLGLLVIGGLLVLALALFWPLFQGADVGLLWRVAVFLPVLVVGLLLEAAIMAFTTMFVVPIMLQDRCGVLSAWRRLWSTIRTEWTEYLVYAIVGSVLAFAAGIGATIAILLAAVLLLIPFVPLIALAIAAHTVDAVVGIAAGAGVALLYVLVLFALSAIIWVPIETYLRYYALLVLGDTNERFDLIPEQRAAVRSGADG